MKVTWIAILFPVITFAATIILNFICEPKPQKVIIIKDIDVLTKQNIILDSTASKYEISDSLQIKKRNQAKELKQSKQFR